MTLKGKDLEDLTKKLISLMVSGWIFSSFQWTRARTSWSQESRRNSDFHKDIDRKEGKVGERDKGKKDTGWKWRKFRHLDNFHKFLGFEIFNPSLGLNCSRRFDLREKERKSAVHWEQMINKSAKPTSKCERETILSKDKRKMRYWRSQTAVCTSIYVKPV